MDIFKFFKDNQINNIDCRFTDLLGTWHHITFPIHMINDDFLNTGFYFDGSSIMGWQPIHRSDMILKPDISTCVLDPFCDSATASMICYVHDPYTENLYEKDPRSVALKCLNYLKSTGIADQAFFGPEPEFFIFDSVTFASTPYHSHYHMICDEFFHLNGTQQQDNHGFRIQSKRGYLPTFPTDSMQDMRQEMCQKMTEMKVFVEKHHHEVAPGQHEIGIGRNELIKCADDIQIYKHVVKNVAFLNGKTATFMAKPVFGDNGSGMHVHQSLWKKGSNIFSGDGYGGLSEAALYYLGGILRHGRSLNALTNPTTNSYKRLTPGFEAPVILAYSSSNRSAACRIPLSTSPHSKRIEIRFPDPTANPYLALSAMMMAGLDGIKNKIHPGDACDEDLFENKKAASCFPTLCGSLKEALDSLEKDHDYLMEGDVFTKSLLNAYLDIKWQEVYELSKRPHPYEFDQYYNS